MKTQKFELGTTSWNTSAEAPASEAAREELSFELGTTSWNAGADAPANELAAREELTFELGTLHYNTGGSLDTPVSREEVAFSL